MNSILKITAIVFLLISTTNFLYAQKCENLEGAWIMACAEYSSADTTFEYSEFESDRIKVLGGNHFAFGFQGYRGDPEFAYSGGGWYEYNESEYTEDIHYHSAAGNVGSTLTFNCRVEWDRWYHEGILPTSRSSGDNVRIREIWKRI